jgi:hypothetical protein
LYAAATNEIGCIIKSDFGIQLWVAITFGIQNGIRDWALGIRHWGFRTRNQKPETRNQKLGTKEYVPLYVTKSSKSI